jgi:hypothetical protein
MPKEVTLQLETNDGSPQSEPIRVSFEDAEWHQLKRFAEFAADVAETPILRARRQISTSIRVDFTKSEQSYTITLGAMARC